MARVKTSTRKSKTTSNHDRYTAELSTGQLVIGMSILLLICLASFLMGVVVGKFDPSLNPEIALDSRPIQEVVSVPSVDAQTASAMETAAAVRKNPPPELRTPRRTENAQAAGGKQASKPKEPEDSAVTPAKTGPTETKPKREAHETPAKTKVAATSPTAGRIQNLDIETSEVKIKPISQTRYGVQVAAFKTRRRARAEVVKRDLEAKSSYMAYLLPSSSGVWVKVVVGSYADRQSVDKVRDDLKQNFGYADCFVTTAP